MFTNFYRSQLRGIQFFERSEIADIVLIFIKNKLQTSKHSRFWQFRHEMASRENILFPNSKIFFSDGNSIWLMYWGILGSLFQAKLYHIWYPNTKWEQPISEFVPSAKPYFGVAILVKKNFQFEPSHSDWGSR